MVLLGCDGTSILVVEELHTRQIYLVMTEEVLVATVTTTASGNSKFPCQRSTGGLIRMCAWSGRCVWINFFITTTTLRRRRCVLCQLSSPTMQLFGGTNCVVQEDDRRLGSNEEHDEVVVCPDTLHAKLCTQGYNIFSKVISMWMITTRRWRSLRFIQA